jgi:hypothetical protein
MQVLALSKSSGISIGEIMAMTADEYYTLHHTERKLYDYQKAQAHKRPK